MQSFCGRTLVIAVLSCTFPVSGQVKPAKLDPQVDFQRQVRPILSDACFQCHGPDRDTRMAGLRLDIREGAFNMRASGAAIVPGNSAKSLLYQRITHPVDGRRMPPKNSHKVLSAQQIETLKRWIDAGAPWSEHWAFTAPVRRTPPPVATPAWVRNPIDSFILAAMSRKGLAPAPEAERRALARRASLDITGLPPEPAAVEAFVKDPGPKAYERYIDKLFESPAWGEHRARYWLDAARYADTHGLHIDNRRDMWPFRDWVIKAFNRNMPFDRFTIEQIAGDLLPDPGIDQLIATGFHRANVTTNEGGVITEEIAAMYAKDRVDTTSTVFLGLTVGCATCHDHKFDPIAQRDFYAMAAFFRNTLQHPLDGNISDPPPVMVVPRDEDLPRWKSIDQSERTLRERLRKIESDSKIEFEGWLGGTDRRKIRTPLEPADELLALTEAAEILVRGKSSEVPLPGNVSVEPGPAAGVRALTFKGPGGIEFPGFDYFEAGRPFTIAAWVYTPKTQDNFTVVGQADVQSRGRGWAFEMNGRIPTFRLTHLPSKTTSIRPSPNGQFEPGSWNHVVFTYDGSRDKAGLDMLVNGKRVLAERRGETRPFEGDFRNYAPLRIASDGSRRSFSGGAVAGLRLYTRVISDDEARLLIEWPEAESGKTKAADELSAAEREALHRYFLNREHASYLDVAGQLRSLQLEREKIARAGTVTHVQAERQDQKPFAHLLHRGMYDQPREKLEPAVPGALPPMPSSYPRNRLGLAQWLVDENNPLTARVVVNRFWQEVFGTGLVKTAEDFGSQGEAPSHPELLDWLAVEFRDSGWDVKRLWRLMLTSATYRQAAVATPLKLKVDPDNRMLSRGPRFRMDAELVRDQALAASGLLNRQIGGPSVKPYQPEGVWEAVAMEQSDTRFYEQDFGSKLYRRSVYTFWKRSAPPSSMEIFNAPSRESCTVRRERTNTPLQALVTLNDTQFVEAARHLAAQAVAENGIGFERNLDYITSRVLFRTLTLKEKEIVRRAHRDYLRHYRVEPADAAKLLAVGEKPVLPGLDAAEVAALSMVANQIFNLDEVLNK